MVAKATLKKVTSKKGTSNAGRRSKYDSAYHPARAKELLSKGSTKAGVAISFGIGYTTLFEWENRYSEFANALKEGCAVADDAVVSSLYKSACGFTGENGKYYPPNVTSGIFWLKNRNPKDWRDKRHVEADVKVADLSEEELTAKIEAIINEVGE